MLVPGWMLFLLPGLDAQLVRYVSRGGAFSRPLGRELLLPPGSVPLVCALVQFIQHTFTLLTICWTLSTQCGDRDEQDATPAPWELVCQWRTTHLHLAHCL